jgi:hypothetical protein
MFLFYSSFDAFTRLGATKSPDPELVAERWRDMMIQLHGQFSMSFLDVLSFWKDVCCLCLYLFSCRHFYIIFTDRPV